MRSLATFLFATFLATTAVAQDRAALITVTGEGRIEAAPDMAMITLGVTSEAETAAAAMDQTSMAVQALMERLADAGIEASDIQTTGLSLNPRWDYKRSSSGENQITGFIASNNVTVRVRALDTLGTALDGVIEAGANSFNGLSFGLQEPTPVMDEARRAAVADARRKAELYAGALGVELGPVLSVSEQTTARRPEPMARMEMSVASEAVPVAPGEMSVTAQVTIVWEIRS